MFLKIIHVILLASIKYFVTLPYAMVIGLDFKQAIIAVLFGGIGGFLFFYYLSKPVIRGFDFIWPFFCRIIPPFFKARYSVFCERQMKKKTPKIFSKKSRLIGKIRNTYGFWGIILATPILLTIPVGAFLASKYYSHRKHIVLYMIISIIGWGAILSGIVHLFPKVFF